MSNTIGSFDAVMKETAFLRARGDLVWYGKVEIGSDHSVNVEVLLWFPSLVSPPGELFIFKRDPNSNDLVIANNFGSTRIEPDESSNDRLTIYYGTDSHLYSRLRKLRDRLAETFLISKYRKILLEGLAIENPRAVRWAVIHGLSVWREIKIFGSQRSGWEQVVPAFIPFEYEKEQIDQDYTSWNMPVVERVAKKGGS